VLFLADESCDFTIVRALRTAGHEVIAVAEISPRAEDQEVLKLAARQKRILLTEDKDFGQLVYAQGQKTVGVLLRFSTSARKQVSRDLVQLVKEQGERLIGCFVVVQPGRIRISHHPKG
jgi:predicted nuclease of predicted toxin-antitoxin system